MRLVFCLIYSLLTMLPIAVQANGNAKGDICPIVRIEPERLPDLNIPRFGHTLFCVNGEITVAGGHTTGYIPTSTAEYFKDGEWHLLKMVYDHDSGCAVVLKSGKVLLCGGYEKHLGIGQTFVAEMYDPLTHTFNGFGCMNKKRALFSGLEIDNGQVVLSGNWYHDDGIEVFDGNVNFAHVKNVVSQRSYPHIFQIAPDDAIILGYKDNYGKPLDSVVIDHLKGESFCDSLFNEWHPMQIPLTQSSENSFIGDKKKGIYAYLFPIENNDGQIAIAKVEGMTFSLLPTSSPVPMQCQWGKIYYYSQILIDKNSQCGYLLGAEGRNSKSTRLYILRIDYSQIKAGKPASLSLYYTDPMDDISNSSPILTPEGNLLLVGGKKQQDVSDNFRPSGTVLLFRFGSQIEESYLNFKSVWWIVLLAVLILAFGIFIIKRRSQNVKDDCNDVVSDINDQKELMQRILNLIIEKKMYLKNDLTTSDVANELGLHRNQVSACINSQGQSFPNLINSYRVEYAKELIRLHPEMKLVLISMECGFANEVSFYRTFKTLTGMTPSEWKAKID
ncbi:MAG: helix-turn-helix domain-containing protein [Prevotella sp.]|nr:helix-turn-helix domain-containing protein [Prevotella sp.]